MTRIPSSLPINEVLSDIVAALKTSGTVVIKAPPGAGKTTGVPIAMEEAGLITSRILIAQPRRLAARSAAARLADLMGSQIGHDVGYQVRFDRRWRSDTKMVAVTYGILLRQLQADPYLEGIDAVLLDEFHERGLESDLSLGMLLRLKQTVRPDLKLIVMSATMAPQPIADFLSQDGAAVDVVESEGRSYPVEIRYAKKWDRSTIEEQVAAALPSVLRATPGHLLVFLPGVGEIRKTETLIRQLPETRGAEILRLYGDLSPDKQDRVLRESRQRKIVLSTNVAETSVTIPGITAVIDSGAARVMRYDPDVGFPRLQIEPISMAAADQRAGRAGRTEAGMAQRLWTQATHRSRPEFDTPEILRTDLAGAVLQLAGWGERSVADFPWLDAPFPEAVATAESLLKSLGAIDDAGITPTGRRMLRLPVHPRLARLLIAGEEFGIPKRIAVTAAMLSERDPFRRGSGPPKTVRGKNRGNHNLLDSRSDILNALNRLEKYADGAEDPQANEAAARHIFRVAEQLAGMLEGGKGKQESNAEDSDIAIMRALLAAYPDRLAKRRSRGSDRAIIGNGQGVKLSGESKVQEGDLFLVIDVQQATGDAKVRQASMVEHEWLDPAGFSERDEAFFHPSLRQIAARRRLYWNDLLLKETPIESADDDQSQALLHEHAIRNWDRIFPQEDTGLQRLLARIRFLQKWNPELELPALDTESLHAVCFQLCRGRKSFLDLAKAPWRDFILGKLSYQQQQALQTHAPERIKVPSGNEVAIEYQEDKPPILAVRLQELFGWDKTPCVANGRVPLLLHLLGPNRQPQQITEDLASFWEHTYPQVRKDLRRRYSKHHWPEDPTQALASRSGLKRDSQ
ncbi:ATP-dependent RNA helicase HrpB [Roseimaritima multifibrata]|uniref:ATP-dependent RNA helicase HrpB n=1 Tax=Roseimaritima multifibrata TaxID=1930274 RepID=A0A517MG26_9BACT|nr:ATP-dependent helicase HrpB [Roseimaritima multifibrata]QDS93717.1 ATP-dependent RNA helicase HrpB [Roseimaritima multifibrata]